MSDSSLSAADIIALTKDNDHDGMNGGYFWWVIIFLIIAMMFSGNGFGFGGNGATNTLIGEDEFIKRDIFNTNQNVSNTSAATQRDILETGCTTQRDVLENRYTTQLGFANANAASQACCCETQKEILQSRYDNSIGQCNIQRDILLGNQNITSQLDNCCCDLKTAIHSEGEATRALIQANTIQDLRDRVNERDRELQSAQLQISQLSQTANITNTLRPFPQPAYITCSPYQSYGNYGFGCGCNV